MSKAPDAYFLANLNLVPELQGTTALMPMFTTLLGLASLRKRKERTLP